MMNRQNWLGQQQYDVRTARSKHTLIMPHRHLHQWSMFDRLQDLPDI